MLKGEVHERFTETFLLGLKQGFIDASIKAVSAIVWLVYVTRPSDTSCCLVNQLANHRRGEYMFVVR